jgi:hypothetical protein
METRLGVWDAFWGNRDDKEEDPTMAKAVTFLKGPEINEVEDWGCGVCSFRKYLRPDQKYVGIDGSNTRFQTKIADLTKYTSVVDGIFMKHVLEHNNDWRSILRNMCSSFTKKAVLVLFTPFSDNETHSLQIAYINKNYHGNLVHIPDISFNKKDIISVLDSFPEIKYTFETISSPKTVYGLEHVIYMSK